MDASTHAAPDDAANPDQIFKTEGAANYANQAPGTLRAWRTAKPPRGPAFIRIGPRSVRYRKSDLDAWLRANTVQP